MIYIYRVKVKQIKKRVQLGADVTVEVLKPLLILHFLRLKADRELSSAPKFSASTFQALQTHEHWHSNLAVGIWGAASFPMRDRGEQGVLA